MASDGDWPALADGEVYVGTNKSRSSQHVYHTGRCKAVERIGPERVQTRVRAGLSDKWELCQYCSGEFAAHGCGSTDRDCPVCGAAVGSTAAHIRNAHTAGGVGDD